MVGRERVEKRGELSTTAERPSQFHERAPRDLVLLLTKTLENITACLSFCKG